MRGFCEYCTALLPHGPNNRQAYNECTKGFSVPENTEFVAITKDFEQSLQI